MYNISVAKIFKIAILIKQIANVKPVQKII